MLQPIQIDPRTGLPIVPKPFQPFLAGMMDPTPMAQQAGPLGGAPAPASSPMPMAGATPPMPAGPLAQPPAQPEQPSPIAAMLQQQAMAAPEGQPEGGGGLGGFFGSDAALGLAAGILEGGSDGQAIGRGFRYAQQARAGDRKSRAEQAKADAEARQSKQAANSTAAFFDKAGRADLAELARSGMAKDAIDIWQSEKGGVKVDARQMGTVPPGYRAEYDAEGRVTQLVPIPGGPAATEAEAAAAKVQTQKDQSKVYADVVTEDIDRTIDVVTNDPFWTTGLAGQTLSGVGGTKAHNVAQLTNTIKANIGFDRLQQMRQNSPTGGALGPVSDFENQLLQATIGALAQSQTSDQLVYNLGRVKEIYRKIVNEGIKPGDPITKQGDGWKDMGGGVRVRQLP
jgi:hypothetical protein